MSRPGALETDAASIDATVAIEIVYKGVTITDGDLEVSYNIDIQPKGSDQPVLVIRSSSMSSAVEVGLADFLMWALSDEESIIEAVPAVQEPPVTELMGEEKVIEEWKLPDADETLASFVSRLKQNDYDLSKWLEFDAVEAKARRPRARVFTDLRL